MNKSSKSTVSRTAMKIVLAIAIAAGFLVILSGLLFNLDKEINVQSRVAPVAVRKSITSLPEFGYIQAHQIKKTVAGTSTPLTGFQALPEYGYIQAHSLSPSHDTYLPAGLRRLAEFSYIQAHNGQVVSGDLAALGTVLPEGLRTLPVFGYIQAHNRIASVTFVAGLPRGLRNLPEAGYIQAHKASTR
jgi:hypothetical protein